MHKSSKAKNWATLPYNSKKIRDRYLITTTWGDWMSLDPEEFKSLNRLDIRSGTPLFSRLKKNNLIIDQRNIDKLTDRYRRLHANLFHDAGLHIAVVTDRCNFGCFYCQSKNTRSKKDMSLKIATKVLGCLFSASNPCVRLEFQGGEPLLNWPAVEFLVKHARKQNKFEKKNLVISLVTNMSLLDERKMDFLIDHDTEVCTSLDGPQALHDQNRIFKGGAPTHKFITQAIEKLRQSYRKRKINKKIGALPTITRQLLSHPKALIDEYVRLGFDSIHLREISQLGRAENNWDRIGYAPEEFNEFWREAMEYIVALNKKGIVLTEEMSVHMLRKILNKTDPFYVDLESPCGAGRSQLAYAPNGDVYTCDEARMIANDMFKLGNVLQDPYAKLMKSESIFYTTQASLLNLWDYNSAFACWSGTCPVMNFYQQNNPVVKITQTPGYKILNFKFEYLLEKIIFDKETLKIFQNWLKTKERYP